VGLGKSLVFAWLIAAVYSVIVRHFFALDATHPGNWLVAILIVIVGTFYLRNRNRV